MEIAGALSLQRQRKCVGLVEDVAEGYAVLGEMLRLSWRITRAKSGFHLSPEVIFSPKSPADPVELSRVPMLLFSRY